MINDIHFSTPELESRLPAHFQEAMKRVRANGLRIGIRNPVFFLRNLDFWYNTEPYTGSKPEVWVAKVISHESLHATLENTLDNKFEGARASGALDYLCNRGGWRYEDTGIPHEYCDEYIRIGMLGLEENTP